MPALHRAAALGLFFIVVFDLTSGCVWGVANNQQSILAEHIQIHILGACFGSGFLA